MHSTLTILCGIETPSTPAIFLAFGPFFSIIPFPLQVFHLLGLGWGGGSRAGWGHGAGQVCVHVVRVHTVHRAAAWRGARHRGDTAYAQGPRHTQACWYPHAPMARQAGAGGLSVGFLCPLSPIPIFKEYVPVSLKFQRGLWIDYRWHTVRHTRITKLRPPIVCWAGTSD